MVLLAIETVTRQGSIAVSVNGACEARGGAGDRTHGERLPAEPVALLASHGRSLADVDRFVIVSGPGSFTGLRVGMAVTQGFALVHHKPVAAVPTLEAIVEAARGDASMDAAPGPVVAACLDGQRGDVFFAVWRLAPGMLVEHGEVLVPASVGTAEEMARIVAAEVSRDGGMVVGLGMARHETVLGAHGLHVQSPAITLAESALRIAERRPELDAAPHALRPIYIRRPDAVLARERAGLAPR